jgi:hypothetical protein
METALVFIHGMGEQRRYADSALLATRLAWQAGAPAPCVDLAWRADEPSARPRARARVTATIEDRPVVFHDVYWAPLVSGRTNFRSLVRWLKARSLRPVGYLAARWASHPELKIATLQEDKDGLSRLERELIDDYLAFASEARARNGPYAAGVFGAFVSFLRERHAGDDALEARLRAARTWLARFRFVNLLTLVRSVPLLAALGAGVLAVPLTAAWLADRLVDPRPSGTWLTLAAGALWLCAFPLARLLVRTIGDVEVYATYVEASERHVAHEAVVAEAVTVLRRALEDEAVARVVLVAHSLGTVVAWDALRVLALETQSGGPLRPAALLKLARVVTYGSPIDKVRYFHFMDDKNDPTFAAVLERLRADTRVGPFEDRPEGLAWDNWYDPADLVAGRLESPNDRDMTAPVRNVAVACGAFPNPFTSHNGYLDRPEVLDGILDALAGRPRPVASSPRALRPRAWATAVELLVPAGLLTGFFIVALWPLVERAAQGDPLGWIALVILMATLFAFA